MDSVKHAGPSNNTGDGPSRSAYSEARQKYLELKHKDQKALTKDEAFSLAVEAAELTMQLMELAKSKNEKRHYLESSNRHLTEAEGIKDAVQWKPNQGGDPINFEPLIPIKLHSDKGKNPLHPILTLPAKTPAPSAPTPHLSSSLGKQPQASSPIPSASSMPKSPVCTREIPVSESILLYRASRLYGGLYPPWTDEKNSATEPVDLGKINLKLSEKHLAFFQGWKRPTEALPPPALRALGLADGPPTMYSTAVHDFVQDTTTDCSFVASIIACVARAEKGFPNLLSKIILPFDDANHVPAMSPTGQYLICLNFNGCLRKVWINDLLPVSTTERLIHVLDRNNPRLLWPALLEKAYLQVRGGYDIPGSNSGTDLWMLTGWLPEQIIFHHDETDDDRLWTRMYDGFVQGEVLITVGTTKISPETEKLLGIASYHDYAVLDLKMVGCEKQVLLKNPWANGTVWKGRYGVNDCHPDDSSSSDSDSDGPVSTTPCNRRKAVTSSWVYNVSVPESFWMSYSDILQNFQCLYLNWQPDMFACRADVHFEWDPSTSMNPLTSLWTKPQFTVRSVAHEEIWVIFSRHFTDRSEDEESTQGEKIFISVYAFKSDGQRVIISRNLKRHSPLVDCPQTLLKLPTRAMESVTLVPVAKGLPPAPHTFTLSVFSMSKVQIYRAKPRYADSTSVEGKWTAETAGGKLRSKSYLANPQYALHLPVTSPVSIILETPKEEVNMHIMLVHSQGKRWESEVHRRDALLNSGTYRPGIVVATTGLPFVNNELGYHDDVERFNNEDTIPKGDYTLILSTFEANQLAGFALTVLSNCNASLNHIPRSGAGRILRRLTDVSFPRGVRRIGAPFTVRRLVTVYFTVKSVSSPNTDPNFDGEFSAPPSSLVRLSIETSLGAGRCIVIASGNGAFMDASSAAVIRTDDVEMTPIKAGGRPGGVRAGRIASKNKNMWIVLERMGPGEGQRDEERFAIESWADVPEWDEFGAWRELPWTDLEG